MNVQKMDNDLSMSDDELGGNQEGGAGNRNIFLQMSLPSLSLHSAQDMNDDIDDNQIDEVEEELKTYERKKKKKKDVPSIFKKNNNLAGAEIKPMEITQTFAFKDNTGTQHTNANDALAAFLNDVSASVEQNSQMNSEP